jgi:Uncharacterized protein conserved in bacteria (DUF2066)
MTVRRRRVAVAGFFALALAAVAAVAPRPAAAQAIDPYLVDNIKVDVEAASTAKAREQALVQGEKDALDRLLKRLTLESDHSRLPQVDDQRRANLLEDFRVRSEKSSAVRYIATLAFRFKRDGIRALLTGAGLTFVETPSKPVVLLPVYRTAAGPVLWDEPNPWRHAWDGVDLRSGLVPFVVPPGDLQDLQAIDAAKAASGDPAALKAIAGRYGANVVFVAVANEGAGGAITVVLSAYNTASGGSALNQTLPVAPGPDRAETLASVARNIVGSYEDRWKRDNMVVAGSTGNALRVVVPIASYADWVELRKRLRSVAMVRNIQVIELTRDQARLELAYAGDVDQLRVALAQSDLALAQGAGGPDAAAGDYTLSLAGGARMAPADAGAGAGVGTEPAAPGKPNEGAPPAGPR